MGFLESLGFQGEEVAKTIHRGVKTILACEELADINPKYIKGFSKLEELKLEAFVDFYSHLVVQLQRHGIGLLDFDAVLPKWGHIGLTLPRLGETRYLPGAEHLFHLLEKLLPSEEPIVKECTTSLVGVNHDGYRLLRDIMGKYIPVFCPYKSSIAPTWRKTPDVTHMVKLWKLHFKLLRKTGSINTPIQQSLLFLWSLVDPSLSVNVTSIQGQLQIYTESIDAFEVSAIALPSNLTIDGITTTLTAFPTPMESFYLFCKGNCYSMYDSLYDSSDSNDDSLDFQGFSSNETTSSCSNDLSSRGSSHKPKATCNDHKPDSSKNIICHGCHKQGHKEIECHELAKWLIIAQAIKKLNKTTRKTVLERYYQFYSTEPPSKQISCSCIDQLCNFCTKPQMTPTQVVNHFNWESYIRSDKEDGFETVAEGENESN